MNGRFVSAVLDAGEGFCRVFVKVLNLFLGGVGL